MTTTTAPPPPPRFIALEGIDGSGTTTQAAAIEDWLRGRGHSVHRTREPSTGPIGTMVRHHLATSSRPMDPAAMALLFAADRLDHIASEIGPALERGEVVITDRYLLSSLAYQSLELPVAWVAQINGRAPRADLNLLVDVPAAVGLQRVAARLDAGADVEEIFDVPETQVKLAAAYRELANRPDVGPVVVIDGQPDPATVTAAIVDALAAAGL